MKIFPISFGFYSHDCSHRNSVFRCYLFWVGRIVENFNGLLFRKPRTIALFAVSLSAVRNGISVIFPGRSPAKIFNAVIPRVAVSMEAHLPRPRLPYKGQQNKLMRGEHFPLTALPKLQKRSSCFGAAGLDKNTNGPYFSEVRHLIQVLIPRYSQPSFHAWNTASKGFPCQP